MRLVVHPGVIRHSGCAGAPSSARPGGRSRWRAREKREKIW
jgi:hypothetical protein